ncbi:glycoside hydrolase family 13 protein [Haloarchaeobius sp. HRN-SO-5]|uniref:glycoside hydrolase family 13 protein n=1 Tax=Haloarchaeobius sp. HRN-SO-5 TaxID=3446118 RepID=UPI003EBD526B
MRTSVSSDERPLDRRWWKEAVVYQIYPRSFRDSDGDGVGDIPGIVEKVDYLDSLGVDVVWLCPVYDSPNVDNGYDIRDYRSILAAFGDMTDWETLCSALHERDIRLIMDLVVNHTSDEHEWFQRSRRRDPGYEDYYHWRDGPPDQPPNNWESNFGGPAWTYDEVREQWYLHLFDAKQPDLNWRNPDVREDVREMVTWWLEKGIDGFRMDVINFISKADGLPDGDPDNSPVGAEHYVDGPRVHEYLRELYDTTFSNYDIVTVGEMPRTPVEEAGEYLGEDGDGLSMIFHFEHMSLDEGPRGRWDVEEWGDWDLREFKAVVTRWQDGLRDEGWNSLYLGNHDQPRIVSRFGDDGAYRERSAKLIATFLLTMRGTPFVYQGDELGMTNADFRSLDEVDDTWTVGMVERLLASGAIDSYAEIHDLVNYRTRDHSRTPMQWSDDSNAGFTDGDPWLKVNANYAEVNCEAAMANEDSVWHFYRRLVDLRHDEDVLVYGDYDLLLPDHEQFYAYTRTLGDDRLLVVLNWSGDPATFEGAAVDAADADVVVANYDDASTPPAGREFRPYEAVLYRL